MAVQHLAAHEVFRFLRPEQVDAISNAAEILDYKAGDTVYFQGAPATHLYVVLHGQVTLRLPGREGVSLLIDQVGDGAMFGSCVCVDLESYYLTAQCVVNTQLLRFEANLLKRLMADDLRIGYAIQTQISVIYFKRYVDTMKKLQSIVMSIPLEGS